MPRTNNTVAKMPKETLASPRSKRTRVGRLIRARSAIIAVEMRRRFRASVMSRPIFFKTEPTGSGIELIAFDFIYVTYMFMNILL